MSGAALRAACEQTTVSREAMAWTDAILNCVVEALTERGVPNGAVTSQRRTGPNPWDVPAGEDFSKVRVDSVSIHLTRERPGRYRHEAGYRVERRTDAHDGVSWFVYVPGEEAASWQVDTLPEARQAIERHLGAALATCASSCLTAVEVIVAVATGSVPHCATGVEYLDRDWVDSVSAVTWGIDRGTWVDDNDDDEQLFRWDTSGRNDSWAASRFARTTEDV